MSNQVKAKRDDVMIIKNTIFFNFRNFTEIFYALTRLRINRPHKLKYNASFIQKEKERNPDQHYKTLHAHIT